MENTPNYIVWDVNEIAAVCNSSEMEMLNDIIDRVLQKRQQEGKSNSISYLVIANDKPYHRPISEMLALIQASNVHK